MPLCDHALLASNSSVLASIHLWVGLPSHLAILLLLCHLPQLFLQTHLDAAQLIRAHSLWRAYRQKIYGARLRHGGTEMLVGGWERGDSPGLDGMPAGLPASLSRSQLAPGVRPIAGTQLCIFSQASSAMSKNHPLAAMPAQVLVSDDMHPAGWHLHVLQAQEREKASLRELHDTGHRGNSLEPAMIATWLRLPPSPPPPPLQALCAMLEEMRDAALAELHAFSELQGGIMLVRQPRLSVSRLSGEEGLCCAPRHASEQRRRWR